MAGFGGAQAPGDVAAYPGDVSAPEQVTGLAGSAGLGGPSGLEPARRGASGLVAEATVIAALAAVAALVVAVLWSTLAGRVARASTPNEVQISHDALLGCLGIVTGVLTAGLLIFFPGPSPARRVAITLTLVTAGSFLAWAVGRAIGAPVLHAVGMVLLWPLVAAALTTLRSLFALLFSPG